MSEELSTSCSKLKDLISKIDFRSTREMISERKSKNKRIYVEIIEEIVSHLLDGNKTNNILSELSDECNRNLATTTTDRDKKKSNVNAFNKSVDELFNWLVTSCKIDHICVTNKRTKLLKTRIRNGLLNSGLIDIVYDVEPVKNVLIDNQTPNLNLVRSLREKTRAKVVNYTDEKIIGSPSEIKKARSFIEKNTETEEEKLRRETFAAHACLKWAQIVGTKTSKRNRKLLKSKGRNTDTSTTFKLKAFEPYGKGTEHWDHVELKLFQIDDGFQLSCETSDSSSLYSNRKYFKSASIRSCEQYSTLFPPPKEHKVYLDVIEMTERKLLPAIEPVLTEKLGIVLLALKKLFKGTVLNEYRGDNDTITKIFESLEREYTHIQGDEQLPGADKLLTLAENRMNKLLDVCVSPQFKGGVVQYCPTATWKGDDRFKCNAMCVKKLVKREVQTDVLDEDGIPITEEREELRWFMVLIKDVQKGEPIIWYYGDQYFENDSLKHSRQWLTVEEIFAYVKSLSPIHHLDGTKRTKFNKRERMSNNEKGYTSKTVKRARKS